MTRTAQAVSTPVIMVNQHGEAEQLTVFNFISVQFSYPFFPLLFHTSGHPPVTAQPPFRDPFKLH